MVGVKSSGTGSNVTSTSMGSLLKMEPYFRLLRPATLVPPLCGGLLFGLMGIKVSGLPLNSEVISLGFLSGFLLACTNGISNIMNQIHDRDIDKLLHHKRNRPIPSGDVSIDNALSIAIVLIVILLSLAWFFFPPFYGAVLSVILAFSWMYNSPPLRLKTRLFWSNLAIATPRGALGIIVAYSAFADPLDSRILVPALALAIYVFGVNTFKDYEDCEADKKMGISNFCTVYGKEKASKIVLPFLYVPFFVFLLRNATPILSLPLSVVMTVIIKRNPELEGKGVLMWKLFYLEFALMMLLYAAGEFLA